MSLNIESIAYKAIVNFEGQWLYSAYSILQTSLMYQESNEPELSQQVYTIQTIFNVIDFGWACWSLKKIAEELLKKNVISLSEPMTLFHVSLGVSVGLYLTYQASSLLLETDKKRPASAIIGHHLYAARIYLNAVLACLCSYKALSICNLLGQVYCLNKLSKRHSPIHNFEINSKLLCSYLFQGLNFTYTIFQAGLATMQQRHPELAGRILCAQRLLLIADVIALACDYAQLYKYMKKRQDERGDITPIHALLLVISPIIAAAGSYALVRYMKPAVDLNEALKKAAPLATWVEASWETPELHRLSLFLSLSRIIVNLMSAVLLRGRQSFIHLNNAYYQALTLRKISTLSWIHFTQRIFLEKNTVLISLESHFLIHADLSNSLAAIHNYCLNFINKFKVLKIYDQGTFRQIMSASVQPEKMGGDIPPFIDCMTGRYFDTTKKGFKGFFQLQFKIL